MKFTSSSDDFSLIEGCLAGEETAWESLVSKYERLIFSTCRRYNLQQAEAEDIFGRVCLLLLQNLARIQDRARLTAWIVTTTSRECWHYKKNLSALVPARAGKPGEEDPAILEELPDSAPLPEDELLRLERQQQVREALQQLGERCQKLLWHLFYDPTEPSYTQISAALKMPVASIGPNRARCLEKLRAELEKANDNYD
jgi:RNA polymerase sigma factor (sigma-70 family)